MWSKNGLNVLPSCLSLGVLPHSKKRQKKSVPKTVSVPQKVQPTKNPNPNYISCDFARILFWGFLGSLSLFMKGKIHHRPSRVPTIIAHPWCHRLPSRERSPFPQKWHFEDDFPFPKVGYVNSLEGSHPMTQPIFLLNLLLCFGIIHHHVTRLGPFCLELF